MNHSFDDDNFFNNGIYVCGVKTFRIVLSRKNGLLLVDKSDSFTLAAIGQCLKNNGLPYHVLSESSARTKYPAIRFQNGHEYMLEETGGCLNTTTALSTYQVGGYKTENIDWALDTVHEPLLSQRKKILDQILDLRLEVDTAEVGHI